MNQTEIKNIIREEIESVLNEQENFFKIKPSLAYNIYDIVSKHLEQTGNSFDQEFASKNGFFLFLDKNLK